MWFLDDSINKMGRNLVIFTLSRTLEVCVLFTQLPVPAALLAGRFLNKFLSKTFSKLISKSMHYFFPTGSKMCLPFEKAERKHWTHCEVRKSNTKSFKGSNFALRDFTDCGGSSLGAQQCKREFSFL